MPRTPQVSAEQAARFDVMMTRLERRFFPGAREWVCERAHGATLEVAVGTGLNLPHYPDGVRLTGIDLNPEMLAVAGHRAAGLGRSVDLHTADAMALPFPNATFDTVACTFALCEVPDDGLALAESLRVLRPGGSLLLADHVVSTQPILRAGQHLLEWLTIPLSGEHFTRRPILHLDGLGAAVVESERRLHGAVELVHAMWRGAAGSKDVC